jgi:magnesium transporter
MEEQGDISRRLSGYALLIAIPAILFSLYGPNCQHIPLIDRSWGYAAMLGLTIALFGCTWWRLRRAGWI